MNLPDFLARDTYGEILLASHRIGLQHVIHYYNEGYSAEMLVGQYPSLPLALVHKVIAFYMENRGEVDAYVTACRQEMDRQRQAGKHPDWTALRERFEQVQPGEQAKMTPGT